MGLVYDENPGPYTGPPLSRINPNRAHRRHLENYFFLKFMLANGNTAEKSQASKELAICDRKLAYWSRHPLFSRQQAEKDVAELKVTWGK